MGCKYGFFFMLDIVGGEENFILKRLLRKDVEVDSTEAPSTWVERKLTKNSDVNDSKHNAKATETSTGNVGQT